MGLNSARTGERFSFLMLMRTSEVLRRKSRLEGFKEDHCWCKGGAEGRLPATFHPPPAGTQTPPFSFIFDSNKLRNLELVKKKEKSLGVERAEEAMQILPKIAQNKLGDTQTCAALR